MKPIIAITPNMTEDESVMQLNNKYCDAIWNSGGLPIIISYKIDEIENILNVVDGLLLSGGGDIDPFLMGEEPLKSLSFIYPIRDNTEVELCKLALKNNIPILGICRGCQILSIASGGKIYQDINSIASIKHSQQAPKYYPTHFVNLEKNSKLIGIYDCNKLKVNSFHHQAVNTLGDDMIVCAKSNDGIIEAIEHKINKFVIGVQWHPESMFKKYSIHLNLFKEFVANCE